MDTMQIHDPAYEMGYNRAVKDHRNGKYVRNLRFNSPEYKAGYLKGWDEQNQLSNTIICPDCFYGMIIDSEQKASQRRVAGSWCLKCEGSGEIKKCTQP
jgi:hypothetical protein